MNILIVGAGSIGLRHLQNLVSLGYNNISVVSKSRSSIDAYNNIQFYKTIDEATASKKIDAAFVCSVTTLHVQHAIELLQAGITHLYIEKPVSHNLQDVDRLIKIMKEKNAHVKVGYDLHFDKGLQKIKQLLEEDVVGKPLSANAFVGQYLPDWRPQQDYMQSMSAKKESGGGVMLDLIHEFDYLLWLLGEVTVVAAHYNNTHTLKIETEDVCDVLMKFSGGVGATIHLDYLQPQLKRTCIITCSQGTIEWDYANASLCWITTGKQQYRFDYKEQQRNDRLKESIQTFLENKNDERLSSLETAIKSLELVLAAKHSSEQEKSVHIKKFIA